MYKILNANGVETPPYEVCDRDKDEPGGAGKEGGRGSKEGKAMLIPSLLPA